MSHFYCRLPRLTLIVTVFAIALYFGIPGVSHAAVTNFPPGTTLELEGYMWSSTIGWISLNCKTGRADGTSICGASDYKVTINSTGYVSGFAWSSNIGWIKFNGLRNFPVPDGTAGTVFSSARISGDYNTPSSLVFEGWARACAGTAAGGDCSSMNNSTTSGGWDGWISLKGNSHQLRFQSDGTMYIDNEAGSAAADGFFWGSANLGWIAADDSMTWSTVSATLTGSNCTIPRGGTNCTTKLAWRFTPQSMTNRGIYRVSPTAATVVSPQAAGSSTPDTSPDITLSPYNVLHTYEARTGSTVLATKSIKAVCDTANNDKWDGNSCEFDPSTIPVVELTAKPRVIRFGQGTTLYWNIEGVLDLNDCTLTGPKVPNNYRLTASDELTVLNLTSFSNYTLSCVTTGGTDSAKVSIEVIPTVTE